MFIGRSCADHCRGAYSVIEEPRGFDLLDVYFVDFVGSEKRLMNVSIVPSGGLLGNPQDVLVGSHFIVKIIVKRQLNIMLDINQLIPHLFLELLTVDL